MNLDKLRISDMKRTIEKIICNKIQCKNCKDVIESTYVHDFKWCSCKSVAVDGGCEYLRRLGNKEDYEELSYVMKLVEIKTDGFEIVKDALSKNEINDRNVYCHICGSNNVTFQKRNGKLILGDDLVALVCHNCEKIYCFNDVKYRR